ncbi:substrate-binding domain-containing protein [Companilactobacillus huachuanensis]|uniref:Substrate-binding domain-containing protein n=1 Tax=Companilactobacillus huachuanensis TaxID=2559914 RepID=A0ABW1RQK4_9LACO|nr:substrate-binding domain-containing protein [Companilactobacillus huachuanensis]
MKIKKSLIIIMTLLLTVVLTACGGSKSNSSEKSKKVSGTDSKTLVVVLPAADHGWLSGVSYYAQKECKDLGLKDYKVITSNNVNDQASQLEELVSQKVGAIVLEPFTDEVSVSAKKVVNAKIPLVVFDRKVKANYNQFISGSNPEIGKKSAEYLGNNLNGKGTIAVLNVPSSGSVSSERVGSFKKVMKGKYPNIKLVDMTADSFTQEDGLKTAKDMLSANKQVDAIFSIDDESSMGILQAVKESKRNDIKYISGVGGSQNYFKKIKNNKTDITLFTATYSPSMIGEAVKSAHNIMEGKKVKKNVVIKTNIVTKNNVEKFVNTKSPY